MNNWAKLIKFFIYTILFSLVASYSMALSSDWSVGETSKLRLISAYSQNDSKNFMIGVGTLMIGMKFLLLFKIYVLKKIA